MSDDPVAVSLLAKARASKDDLEARLLLAATVDRVARDLGVQSVVTGGTAVDFYVAGAAGTSAAYPEKWRASADVDLVVLEARARAGTLDQLRRALQRQLGLVPRSYPSHDGSPVFVRTVAVPDFGYGLEIVGEEISLDPRAERVVTVDIDEGTVVLQGPEDTALHYAESGWDTYNARDWERALAVYRASRARDFDEEYLLRRAKERGQEAAVEAVLALQPLRRRRF